MTVRSNLISPIARESPRIQAQLDLDALPTGTVLALGKDGQVLVQNFGEREVRPEAPNGIPPAKNQTKPPARTATVVEARAQGLRLRKVPVPVQTKPVTEDNAGGGGMEVDPLAHAREHEARMSIATLGPLIAGEDQSPRTRMILTKLEEPVSMSFAKQTPLEDVLKYIKSATTGPNEVGLAIYVDPVGLEEVDKTMKTPVTIDMEGVPLKTTLRLILKQIGLAYCVKDGVLMISSAEGINQELLEAASPEQKMKAGVSPYGGRGFQ